MFVSCRISPQKLFQSNEVAMLYSAKASFQACLFSSIGYFHQGVGEAFNAKLFSRRQSRFRIVIMSFGWKCDVFMQLLHSVTRVLLRIDRRKKKSSSSLDKGTCVAFWFVSAGSRFEKLLCRGERRRNCSGVSWLACLWRCTYLYWVEPGPTLDRYCGTEPM